MKGISLAPAVLVTLVMSMQIVFLLISQYTVLSKIQPGVGNWVEITGKIQTVQCKSFLQLMWLNLLTRVTHTDGASCVDVLQILSGVTFSKAAYN